MGYPISPTKALFFLKATAQGYGAIITERAEVEKYNALIAEHAHEQIFGNSASVLDAVSQYI
jgi:hypothetical protein